MFVNSPTHLNETVRFFECHLNALLAVVHQIVVGRVQALIDLACHFILSHNKLVVCIAQTNSAQRYFLFILIRIIVVDYGGLVHVLGSAQIQQIVNVSNVELFQSVLANQYAQPRFLVRFAKVCHPLDDVQVVRNDKVSSLLRITQRKQLSLH